MEGGAAVEDTDIIQLYWARDEGAIAATDEKYGTLCRSLSHNLSLIHI